MVHISELRQIVGTMELNFRCSRCVATNTVDALRFKTINKLYGIIPVWVVHETAVKCPGCDATFRMSADLESLSKMSEDEISRRFKLRIGLVAKFLVIAGWLLIVTGPIALPLFVAAWFMVPKATGGWRLATTIGLGFSILLTAALFAVILSN